MHGPQIPELKPGTHSCSAVRSAPHTKAGGCHFLLRRGEGRRGEKKEGKGPKFRGTPEQALSWERDSGLARGRR